MDLVRDHVAEDYEKLIRRRSQDVGVGGSTIFYRDLALKVCKFQITQNKNLGQKFSGRTIYKKGELTIKAT